MLTDKEIARFLALHGLKLRKHPDPGRVDHGGSPYIVWRGDRWPSRATSRTEHARGLYGKREHYESIEGLIEIVKRFNTNDGWGGFSERDLEYEPVEWS